MNTCANCGAPEGQRIFRAKAGITWTRDVNEVKTNNSFYSNSTMVYLDVMDHCNKCAFLLEKQRETRP